MKAISLFTLSALALIAAPAAAQSVAAFEFWVDDGFETRQRVEQSGRTFERTLDLADLPQGIHRVQLRALDTEGRWSALLCRYFLRPGRDFSAAAPAAYEYSLDGGQPVSGALAEGSAAFELDAAALPAGVHTLRLRFSDTEGRWSAPLTQYFLRVGQDYSGNALTQYEYWFDDQYESRAAGATADGNIAFEVPVEDFACGLHRVQFRAQDAAGRWSAPWSRYFVRTEPALAGNQIAAYEYWFNAGKRRRVDVSPANPYENAEIWVDIADILPNAVPDDYAFDLATRTATCPDDVVFGICFVDARDKRTAARLDTFAYDVKQAVSFDDLENGVLTEIADPEKGRIYGFRFESEGDKPLLWRAESPCCLDVYDESGQRVFRKPLATTGFEEEMPVGAEGGYYALVHTIGADTLRLSCTQERTASIGDATGGLRVAVAAHRVTLSGAARRACAVYDLQGVCLARRSAAREEETFGLAPGVYVVTVAGGADQPRTFKVTVP